MTTIFDVSQPIEPGMSFFPGDPEPQITQLPSDPPWRSSLLHLGTHVGTHIDAPSHFSFEATLTDLPPDRFIGRGVVIDVPGKGAGDLIGLPDVEPARSQLEHGAWAVFRTGWDRHWATPSYLDHPVLAPDLARALVEWGVGLVAVDMLNPDNTPRGDSIIHEILLGAGTLIVENVTGLDRLTPDTLYGFSFLPLKLAGIDGSPVRGIAWEGTLPG